MLLPRIAAACLLIWWCRGDEHLLFWLTKSASDITLSFRCCGNGTSFQLRKFGYIEEEEKAKQHLGMSASGKCRVLVVLAESVEKDRGTSDPAAIITAFKETEVRMDGWSAETMGRYLAVGRKLIACDELCSLLQLAEFSNGRSAHFDSITNLRALIGRLLSDTLALALPKFA
jgi:hypothetical protein